MLLAPKKHSVLLPKVASSQINRVVSSPAADPVKFATGGGFAGTTQVARVCLPSDNAAHITDDTQDTDSLTVRCDKEREWTAEWCQGQSRNIR